MKTEVSWFRKKTEENWMILVALIFYFIFGLVVGLVGLK